MKIFIICSKVFYARVPLIKTELEELGHQIILPNSYDNPNTEQESYMLGKKEHQAFKKRMFTRSRDVTKNVDAVLALNFKKHSMSNYIGGATFLEIYDAFMLGKKIFLWNDIPKGVFSDEIHGFAPVIINGDISKIS